MGATDGEPAVGAARPPRDGARLTPGAGRTGDSGGDPHWTRLQALFDGALAAADSDRAAWLAAACPDDPGLCAEVARMLEAHRRTGILDRAPAGLAAVLGARLPDVDPDPDAIRARLAAALDGRYAIERELGRGGMAIVYLARERKHGRRVVLKVLRPEIGVRYGTERFVREVQIAARLAHPHIIGLLDSGDAEGLLYYVMPWIEGESLHARIAREGALPVAEAVPLLADVAGALAHAHRRGVVHRDLKPANVLWADGHAFLLDFGVAKLALPMSGDDPVGQLAVTREGHAVGTLAYMAPEQGAGVDADHRVDLYAWGLLAFELLTGRLPGPGVHVGPRAGAALRQRPDVPPALADLVEATLAAHPEQRPADADAITAALGAMGALVAPSTGGGRTVAPRDAPRRRGRRALASVGALAVAAGALGIYAVQERAPPAGGGLLAGPVAVAALANETGDPSLDAWGRMAGDWITQGLQETGQVAVVPWPTARGATDPARGRPDSDRVADPVAQLRDEAGARTIVTGAYYLADDSLRFHVEITDARDRRLLGAPPPVVVPRDSAQLAVRVLRDRLMAAVAIWSDERLAAVPDLARRPPTYAAYQAFDRALERFLAQEYVAAAPAFREAYALDTTFLTPLLYAATAYWNADAYAAADTVSRLLRSHTAALGAHDQAWADFLDASLAGQGVRALAAIRRAAALAPESRASYTLARVALEMGRPEEALAALDRLDPDRGDMRGWSSYWTQRAHALHLLGDHERELEAARAMRARYPDRQVGLVFEARALATLGRGRAIDSVLAAARALPPTTYWSQGAAMVAAGQEHLAHGDAAAGGRRLEQGMAWLRTQLAITPAERGHRYWLGSALYALGRWDEAERTFAGLARDFPGELRYRGLAALSAARAGLPDPDGRVGIVAPHERGTGALFRARLAALRGQRPQAAALLADALRDGVEALPWMHAWAYPELALLSAERAAIPAALGGTAAAP